MNVCDVLKNIGVLKQKCVHEAKMNGVDEMGPLQNQVTALDDQPEIVLNNLL